MVVQVFLCNTSTSGFQRIIAERQQDGSSPLLRNVLEFETEYSKRCNGVIQYKLLY